MCRVTQGHRPEGTIRRSTVESPFLAGTTIQLKMMSLGRLDGSKLYSQVTENTLTLLPTVPDLPRTIAPAEGCRTRRARRATGARAHVRTRGRRSPRLRACSGMVSEGRRTGRSHGAIPVGPSVLPRASVPQDFGEAYFWLDLATSDPEQGFRDAAIRDRGVAASYLPLSVQQTLRSEPRGN